MCKLRGTKSAAAVHTDRVPFLISARHATFLPSFGCIFFLFFLKLLKMFKNLEDIGKYLIIDICIAHNYISISIHYKLNAKISNEECEEKMAVHDQMGSFPKDVQSILYVIVFIIELCQR